MVDASLTVSLDDEGEISSVSYVADGVSKTLNSSNATLQEEAEYTFGSTNDGKDEIALARIDVNQFEYQTYGLWGSNVGTSSSSDGTFSVGAATEGAKIATEGTATFEGSAGGIYTGPDGQNPRLLSAFAGLRADFAKREVEFATLNTQVEDYGSNPDLDMTGSLSYAAGKNALSGTIATAGGMSGSVNGQFYGPSAQEIGGVFSLTGSGSEKLIGAFGATTLAD